MQREHSEVECATVLREQTLVVMDQEDPATSHTDATGTGRKE
jgi:hypothetical protein